MEGQEIVVDEHDSPIGAKRPVDIQYEDIYRVSALWLTDTETGDILLAQRKWDKKNDPGKWGPAVAGTVEVGESYKDNVVKETKEEIGLSDIEFQAGPKTFTDDGKHKFFCQWYFASVNKDRTEIKFLEKEVETVRWAPKDQLLRDVKKNPQNYTPSMPKHLAALGVK